MSATRAASMPWARSIAVWLLIIFAESVHGVLRTLYLAPLLGDFRARQVSVFTASLIIFAIAFATIRWIGTGRRSHLWGIGVLWVLLTVAFEFSLGRFVLELDWERLFSDYNLGQGGLMGLGLAAMCVTPLATAKLRGLRE
jgi:hypothetical protein